MHTIDDVVDALTWIVDDARERFDRLGLFAALNRVSPAMAWLDRAGGRWDEALAETALVRWRATAWRRATGLARTAVDERPARIGRIDRATTLVARRLCPRPGRMKAAVWSRATAWVRAQETVDVADVIDAIR